VAVTRCLYSIWSKGDNVHHLLDGRALRCFGYLDLEAEIYVLNGLMYGTGAQNIDI
jgi:hypothetical protein